MLGLAIAAVLLSAAICYAIGYAVVAPRDSFVRSKRGVWLLVIGALSFVPLPLQLPALGSAASSVGDMLPGLSVTWPSGLPRGTYFALWLLTSGAALLFGMRIWNAGKPGWRASASGSAYDSSAAGRAAALIAMADSLDDVFDALRRTSVDARAAERLAEQLRGAGRRLGGSLPAEGGAAYKMVAAAVPAGIAPIVTRYLLEGAGRGGQIASVNRP